MGHNIHRRRDNHWLTWRFLPPQYYHIRKRRNIRQTPLSLLPRGQLGTRACAPCVSRAMANGVPRWFHAARNEPTFLDSDVPHDEVGVAWELYMFGGRIQTINLSPTPMAPHGLARLPIEMALYPGSNAFKDPQRRIAPLSTKWISNAFSQTWWSDRANAAERAPGNVGLTPLRATVFRTTDDFVFRTDAYDTGGNSEMNRKQLCGHYWKTLSLQLERRALIGVPSISSHRYSTEG